MKSLALGVACIFMLPLRATAQQVFTLVEIEGQVSSFQLNMGQTAAGGTAAGPPIKCSLAVSPFLSR